MKKFRNAVDTVLKPQVFAVFYLVWLCINMIAVINPLPFTRIFLAFFAVWAFAVCVKQYFFSGIAPYKNKYMPILLAFLITAFLAEVIRFQYTGVKMLVQFCFFALTILVLYSEYKSDAVEYQKIMLQAAKGIGFIISITMLVSIIMFITLYSDTTILRNGAELHFGFYENRLVGVFTSPNVGGSFAMICIWCSLLVFELHKNEKTKIFWRVLASIQIFLAAAYIPLALSRGTYITFYVFLICYMLLHSTFKREESMTKGKQIAFRILCTVVVCLVTAGVFSVLHTASTKLMTVHYNAQMEAHADDPQKAEIYENAQLGFDGRVEANREDIDISNKRFDIWETHVSLLKGKNWIFGIGNPVTYYEKTIANGGEFTEHQKFFIDWASGNMHNGYLQILVNCGIVPFLLMLAFLILCVIKCIQYVVGLGKGTIDPKSPASVVFSLALPMVVAFVVNNVMETNFVLMGANFFQAIFWFCAGACVLAIKETNASKNGVVKK